jgi:hypothetical protein
MRGAVALRRAAGRARPRETPRPDPERLWRRSAWCSGIPVAMIGTASAAEYTAGAGNLADRQLMDPGRRVDGPVHPAARRAGEAARRSATDRRHGRRGDSPSRCTWRWTRPSSRILSSTGGRRVARQTNRRQLERRESPVRRHAGTARAPGAGPVGGRPGDELLTVEDGELRVAPQSPTDSTRVQRIEPRFTSLPTTFITPQALRQRGWHSAESGRWLVESRQSLSADQLRQIRSVAAGRRSHHRIPRRPAGSGQTAPRSHHRGGAPGTLASWP